MQSCTACVRGDSQQAGDRGVVHGLAGLRRIHLVRRYDQRTALLLQLIPGRRGPDKRQGPAEVGAADPFGFRGRSLPHGFRARATADPVLRGSHRSDDANGFANDGPGALWMNLDETPVRQQVRGRPWTTMDALDLATDL